MCFPGPTSGRNHRDATSGLEDVLTGRGDAVGPLAQFPPDAAHLTVRLGTLRQSPVTSGRCSWHNPSGRVSTPFSLLTFLALLGLKPACGLEAALQLISTGLRPFKNLLRAHDVTSTLCAASGLLRALHEKKKILGVSWVPLVAPGCLLDVSWVSPGCLLGVS